LKAVNLKAAHILQVLRNLGYRRNGAFLR